jgi:hypothetical protein
MTTETLFAPTLLQARIGLAMGDCLELPDGAVAFESWEELCRDAEQPSLPGVRSRSFLQSLSWERR